MFKRTLLALVAVSAIAAGTASAARVYYGFNVGVANAPPPPHFGFQDEPTVVIVPRSRVYVVEQSDDCDLFRMGTRWYANCDGYWYRASSFRGPFVAVDVRRVPKAVLTVPAKHWKHHPHGGPPGQTKKYKH